MIAKISFHDDDHDHEHTALYDVTSVAQRYRTAQYITLGRVALPHAYLRTPARPRISVRRPTRDTDTATAASPARISAQTGTVNVRDLVATLKSHASHLVISSSASRAEELSASHTQRCD